MTDTPRQPRGPGYNDAKLRARLRNVAIAAFLVTIVLLVDPLRLFDREANATILGMLLTTLVVLFGLASVDYLKTSLSPPRDDRDEQ